MRLALYAYTYIIAVLRGIFCLLLVQTLANNSLLFRDRSVNRVNTCPSRLCCSYVAEFNPILAIVTVKQVMVVKVFDQNMDGVMFVGYLCRTNRGQGRACPPYRFSRF